MTERWAPVAENPDYQVSDLGRVRHANRILSPWSAGRRNGSVGYPSVTLGGQARAVHVLVLEAFVGPCPDGMEARHLDGNSKHNALTNLAWGTPEQNAQDRVEHGRARRMGDPAVRRQAERKIRKRKRRGNRKYSDAAIERILTLRGCGYSHATISRETGISNSYVGYVLSGRSRT